MITTKKQMALECTKAHHGLIKSPVYAEIRGNLLKTFKRYMRLDKQTLHNKCLIALAYNCDVMQRCKLHKKRVKRDLQAEVDELRQRINELLERDNELLARWME